MGRGALAVSGVPEAFRRSTTHRALWATTAFLADLDPAGPFPASKAADVRLVAKAAVDRRRTVLEHRAADRVRGYFRVERGRVARAVRAGGDPDRSVAHLEPLMRATLDSALRDSALTWARWTADRAPRVRRRVRRAEPQDLGADLEAWLAENAGKKVSGISDTTRSDLARAIAAGVKEGESAEQIARRVDKFYLEDVIPNRAMTIARTEVGSAVNWMQHQVAVGTGVAMDKEWLALNDDRTREDHADADGQLVDMDDPFDVGEDQLMFPMDDSLGAGPEQIINCRCSVLYHVKE